MVTTPKRMKRPSRVPKEKPRPKLLEGARELAERRARLDMTQPELAEHLAVSLGTIKRWETGWRPIPRIALRLLGYIEREAQAGARERLERQRKER